MEFGLLETLSLGILALLVGKYLTGRFTHLQRWSIPESIAGGILFALVFTGVYLTIGMAPVFDLRVRDILLVYFFTAVGLNADARSLRAGGFALVLLVFLTTVMISMQNGVGVYLAKVFGIPSAMGVVIGSMSLTGGHGTVIGWASTMTTRFGVENAEEAGLAVATAGLVIGSLLGGPVARLLIHVLKLKPAGDAPPDIGVAFGAEDAEVDYFSILRSLLALNVAVFIGLQVNEIIAVWNIVLPTFVPAMFSAILLTNTVPHLFKRLKWPAGTMSLAIISELALGIFLGMSLMSLRLWSIAALAVPILVILLAQTLVTLAYALLVIFPAMGRKYDAAVISGGFVGLSLGAVPVALATMTAVTRRCGAAHRAFIIVPLAGAFFIDVLNSLLIGFFAAANAPFP